MASIAVIGANGKMGSLICESLRALGKEHEVNAVVRGKRGRISKLEGSGFRITTNARKAISSSNVVILCLKPDQFEGWLSKNGSAISRDKTLLSCMTAFSPDKLAKMTSSRNTAQFMPSIIMGRGRVFLPVAFGSNLAASKKEQIRRILNGFGKVYEVPYHRMPHYTLVSMAPALLSRFINSVAENSGVPRRHALEMLVGSMEGTSKMLGATDPRQLITEVRTPNGWTDVALTSLERAGLDHMTSRMFAALREKHKAAGWSTRREK